ncbi:MAG: Ig-like domain repeat protein, partial [Aquihabitans sp.]
DPASPVRGDDVTFTAEVDPTPQGGTVQFTVDGVAFGGPVAVSGGTAVSPSTDALTAGGHTVSAAYSGDDAFGPSTSSSTSFTVAKKASSTTVVDVRPDIPSAGEDVAVDLSVSPAPAGGTVQLALDGTDVGAPITLDGDGEATGTLPDVGAGDHTVTATFSGDDDLLSSDDSASITVFEPREAFVRRAYLAVLGRPADDGGVAFQVRNLEAGMSPAEVTRRLATSGEGRRRLVELSFQRALGRSTDPAGRAYWVQQLDEGLTAEGLLAGLIASPESYQRNGSDPEGIALALYRIHLGRTADASGLASWTARVAAANTPAGRRHTALTFGRSSEATRVAVLAAVSQACGTATPVGSSELEARWAASGRNPLVLRGAALALMCAPEGLTS